MNIKDKMSPDIRHILDKEPKGVVRFGSGIMLLIIIISALVYAFTRNVTLISILKLVGFPN